MIENGIAELIVGAVRDPVVGLHLIVGMGGVMTEIFTDARVLLLPTEPKEILTAIESLRIAPVLNGWRGRPAADVDAVVDIVLKVQELVMTFADTLLELDINPLIVRSDGAFAVDAMIRLTKRHKE